MKKQLPALSALLLATASLAQIPNGSFENWSPSGAGYDEPDQWITWNSVTWASASVLSCEEGTPGAVGSSYAKITTRSLPGLGILPGLVLTGDQISGTAGFPYTLRPGAMNGQYQFNIPPGDGGMITVVFTKWNTGTQTQDDVGGGVLSISPGTQSSWLSFSIPITYLTADYPDTAIVSILSSMGAGIAGSTVSIDDLTFGTASSVAEATTSGFTMNTSVSDLLEINAGSDLAELTVIEMSGRTLLTRTLAGRNASLSMGMLATGIYVAQVRFVDGTLASQVFVKH